MSIMGIVRSPVKMAQGMQPVGLTFATGPVLEIRGFAAA